MSSITQSRNIHEITCSILRLLCEPEILTCLIWAFLFQLQCKVLLLPRSPADLVERLHQVIPELNNPELTEKRFSRYDRVRAMDKI